MRRLEISKVVCTPTADRLAQEGNPDGSRQWSDMLGDVGVVYEVAGDPAALGESFDPGVLGVGATSEDVWLRDHVEIYIHVGAMSDVGRKRADPVHTTVPVVGQGGAGARNALRWVIETAAHGMEVVQHRDIAGHAMACASSYTWPGKVLKAEQSVRAASAALRAAFPQVRATFGTGFPFYCAVDATEPDSERSGVPASIQRFTVTQADEFANRLVRNGADDATVQTRETLERAGLALTPTQFTAYEYTRWGAEPPSAPPTGTLRDFVAANVLDHADRIWPCHLCTALADRAKFPEQAWERDFMTTCVSCVQTPFLPRAVGVLGSDIDLVALVDDDSSSRPVELAAEITSWIDQHPEHFRHDTRWTAQLFGDHGPFDVFVVSTEGFFACVDAMAAVPSNWLGQTVTATVTWLPVTTIEYELGKYFALCMEPLEGDAALHARLAGARRRFARVVSADEVINAYEGDSFYLRQLVENAEVRELLAQRMRRWAGGEAAGGDAPSLVAP